MGRGAAVVLRAFPAGAAVDRVEEAAGRAGEGHYQPGFVEILFYPLHARAVVVYGVGGTVVPLAVIAGAEQPVAALHVPELALGTALADARVLALLVGFLEFLVGGPDAGLVALDVVRRAVVVLRAFPAGAAVDRIEERALRTRARLLSHFGRLADSAGLLVVPAAARGESPGAAEA
jgi:hypothetical protein